MDIRIAMATDDDNDTVGDLFLENGTVRLTATMTEEVAQELFIRFKLFRGEWFLDPSIGVPYYQVILRQKTPLSIVSQIFQQVIKRCPGVASLQSFSLVPGEERMIALTFTCILASGETLRSDDFGPFLIGGVS